MKTYIDIHTHVNSDSENILSLRNIFVNEAESINQLNNEYFSMGIHPWYFDKDNFEVEINNLSDTVSNKKIIAIGETGIDKLKAHLELQKQLFVKHIELSELHQKPLIIHCVRAYNEIISLKKALKPKMKWIIHGFNGNLQIAKQLTENDIYVSFGKTLYNQKPKDIFNQLPLEYIFLETDEMPNAIKEIYEKAALIKNSDCIEINRQILHNFATCFNIHL